ncbi:hypothetical protein M9H77_17334 [Catharanthus roseus]|uniref:Uncharacterized protein n=1 Tax=Catharanthus roseus TaxID=4058 RepID=A0ACC0B4B8_CATRO|nr:hypothetical protein M9H77_17334 [Catharanthus roseus]
MSSRNGDVQNVVQDVEAMQKDGCLRGGSQNLGNKRFDEMINRFYALGVNANRNRNDGGQRPRDQRAQGCIANVPVAANVQNQSFRDLTWWLEAWVRQCGEGGGGGSASVTRGRE